MSEAPQEQFVLAQKYVEEVKILFEQRQYKTAFPILKKADTFTFPEGEASDIVRADIWDAMSDCYAAQTDYQTALSFNQQALDIRMKIFGAIGEPTLEALISRGWIWGKLGKYRKELDYYHAILKQCQLTPPNNSLTYGRLFFHVGGAYKTLEDYWQAILYFQKATEIFQSLPNTNKYYQALTYKSIGVCYAQVTDLKEATFYFQKALDEYNHHKYLTDIADVYIDMGLMYNRINDVQQAIVYFHKSLFFLNKLDNTSRHSIGAIKSRSTLYSSLGRAYSSLKDFEKAGQYLQKTLTGHLQIFGAKHPRVAHTYYLLGSLHNMKKSYWEGIQYLQKGLVAFISTFNEKEVYQNPSLQDLQNLENNVGIILLANKARVFKNYYLEVETTDKNIHIALESAELAIGLMEQMRMGYLSDHSKLSIEQGHRKAYEIGLDVAYTAWKKLEDYWAIEKAFLFAEKAKAVLLLSAMQGEIAKIQSSIPKVLLQKEQNLKKQLVLLDKTIQTQKKAKGDEDSKEAAVQKLQIKFLEYHQEYSQLMKQMEEIHPDYYQLKYQTQTISIAKIQTLLQTEELLIQYCLYDKQLFIFAIGADSLCFEVIKFDIDLALLIEAFQKTIFLSDLENYISIAHQLYNLLLKPIEAKWKAKKQLIIIPDGALHRLNFDALIHPISPTKFEPIEKFSQLPYLLRDFQVHYHYSATLIGQSHQKTQIDIRREIEDGFLGVAPVKFGKRATGASGYILKSKGNGREMILKSGVAETDVLVDLEETEIEVKKVYELFEEQQKKATALFYEMASKEQLLEYIEDYKHILLSTHGFSDTENAALSGLNLYVEGEGENTNSSNEKGKLYLSEVMNLQLKADLVVLSSCESGVGKLQQGEGMMALHRAFLYAGASNIVYSLFKVPQDSTSKLVQAFFGHVLEGDVYSTALHKAKLGLIEDESIEPIDWAGFALIGA
ncbi:MAG: CHAT domain-containing protein [Chitinophagales bacterium]